MNTAQASLKLWSLRCKFLLYVHVYDWTCHYLTFLRKNIERRNQHGNWKIAHNAKGVGFLKNFRSAPIEKKFSFVVICPSHGTYNHLK